MPSNKAKLEFIPRAPGHVIIDVIPSHSGRWFWRCYRGPGHVITSGHDDTEERAKAMALLSAALDFNDS